MPSLLASSRSSLYPSPTPIFAPNPSFSSRARPAWSWSVVRSREVMVNLRRDVPGKQPAPRFPTPSSVSAPSRRSSQPTCCSLVADGKVKLNRPPPALRPERQNSAPPAAEPASPFSISPPTPPACLAKSAPIPAKPPISPIPTTHSAGPGSQPAARKRPPAQPPSIPTSASICSATPSPPPPHEPYATPPPRPPSSAAQHVGYNPRPLRRPMRPPLQHRQRRPLHRHPGLRPQRRRLFNAHRHGQVPPVPAAHSRRPRATRPRPRHLPQALRPQIRSMASATPATPPASASPGFSSAIPPPPPSVLEKTGGGAGFGTYIALNPDRQTGIFLAITDGQGESQIDFLRGSQQPPRRASQRPAPPAQSPPPAPRQTPPPSQTPQMKPKALTRRTRLTRQTSRSAANPPNASNHPACETFSTRDCVAAQAASAATQVPTYEKLEEPKFSGAACYLRAKTCPTHPHQGPRGHRPTAAHTNRNQEECIMISVSNVTMRYGSKVLFEDVSTSLYPPAAATDSPAPTAPASPPS